MKQFKPMLAPNEQPNLENIQYPMFASFKLDGIRCIFKDGEMLSRSLKPIRNKKLQEKFQFLKDMSKNIGIFDGELYAHDLTFQEITHFVMTEDIGEEQLPNDLKFYCFDYYGGEDCVNRLFKDRIDNYNRVLSKYDACVCVEQFKVNSKNDVDLLFEKALELGYEGLILKHPDSLYKFGRGTFKEGSIYKVKPFKTYDLPILDVYERMENVGESKINELGYKQKEKHNDDMKPTGIAAGFLTEFNDKPMKVTLTGTEEFRKEIWNNKESYIGKVMEIKGMEVGSKDVLRHPIFVRFRLDK